MGEQQEFEARRELEIIEADRRWDEAVVRLNHATEYAQAGIKGLFLANGGAIVALLTFVGNAKSAQIGAVGIRWAFVWFSLGLFAVLATYILAYVSQASSMQASANRSWQAASVAHGTGEKFEFQSHEVRANRAEDVGIGLVISSLLLFIIGAFVALFAIT